MSKTKEELNAIKAEYDDVKEKLTELTDEELEQVTGGGAVDFITELLKANQVVNNLDKK